MTTLNDERIRAAEAAQLLENPLFKQAFDAAEKSILDQMDEVKMRDVEMHTRLILAWQVLGIVKGEIARFVNTGDMAKMQLAAKKHGKG